MSDLVEFLLARIAEDEAMAQAAQERSSYGWSDNAFTEAQELAENEGARKQATEHIARWAPARVLAECDAKRQIVDWCGDEADGLGSGAATSRRVLALLALPYAEHRDYRQEWRP